MNYLFKIVLDPSSYDDWHGLYTMLRNGEKYNIESEIYIHKCTKEEFLKTYAGNKFYSISFTSGEPNHPWNWEPVLDDEFLPLIKI